MHFAYIRCIAPACTQKRAPNKHVMTICNNIWQSMWLSPSQLQHFCVYFWACFLLRLLGVAAEGGDPWPMQPCLLWVLAVLASSIICLLLLSFTTYHHLSVYFWLAFGVLSYPKTLHRVPQSGARIGIGFHTGCKCGCNCRCNGRCNCRCNCGCNCRCNSRCNKCVCVCVCVFLQKHIFTNKVSGRSEIRRAF